MPSAKKALRSGAAVAGILLQGVFLFAFSVPPMVWCHKPGGEAALEFAVVAGECPCDQCALCREHTPAADPAAGPALRASHCIHNEIDSEAGRASGTSQASSKIFGAGALLSTRLFADSPDPAPGRMSLSRSCPDDGSKLPGAAALRC